MAEDAFYRTSTQYRLWSFTPASLLSLRTKTNQLATVRVQTAVQRIRDARSSTETSEGEGGTPASTRGGEREREGEREGQEDVDCLTVDEELKLLRYYCGTLLKMAEEFGMPAEAKVCAWNDFARAGDRQC